MTRWLTAGELAIELGVDDRTIYRWYKKGILVGVGDSIRNLRVVDPGPGLADVVQGRQLDRFAFITLHEFAEVLGMNYEMLKKRLQRERIEPDGLRPSGYLHGKLQLVQPHTKVKIKRDNIFNRTEVRRYLAKIEHRRGQTKYHYSSTIVQWLKRWLATRENDVQVLDALIRQAADVPEPDRTRLVKSLWEVFDTGNALLKECERLTKPMA